MSVQDYYTGHDLPGIRKPLQKERDDIAGDKVCLTNSPGMAILQKQEQEELSRKSSGVKRVSPDLTRSK